MLNNYLNSTAKVIFQGLDNEISDFYIKNMQSSGMDVSAHVVYDSFSSTTNSNVKKVKSIQEAYEENQSVISVILLPVTLIEDAISELIYYKIPLFICGTNNVSSHSLIKIKHSLVSNNITMIGPGSLGIISPNNYNLGFFNKDSFKQGEVAIIGRSGSLIYEIAKELNNIGLGQSTCISIGGDVILGINLKEALKIVTSNENTKQIIIIGESGSSLEEEAILDIKNLQKDYKIYTLFVGDTIQNHARLNSSGSVISGGRGLVKEKIDLFKNNNIIVETSIKDLIKSIKENKNDVNVS